MVKELGYDGMGMLWLDDLPEWLEAFDSMGLKVPQIYLNANLGLGPGPDVSFGGAPFDPRLKQDLPLLKGRGIQMILILYGFKPSEPVAYARAIKIVREIADLVGSETGVLLSNIDSYPPKIAVDDLLALVNEVNRPNVGIMLNFV